MRIACVLVGSRYASMPKKTFGSRREPPGGRTTSTGNKYTKVDFLRSVIAAAIHEYKVASAADKDALAMRIRLLQDQLASSKRLTVAQDHRSKDLEWVDIWRPD